METAAFPPSFIATGTGSGWSAVALVSTGCGASSTFSSIEIAALPSASIFTGPGPRSAVPLVLTGCGASSTFSSIEIAALPSASIFTGPGPRSAVALVSTGGGASSTFSVSIVETTALPSTSASVADEPGSG